MDWTALLPGGGLAIGVIVIVLISRWMGPTRPTNDPTRGSARQKGREGMDQFQHNRRW